MPNDSARFVMQLFKVASEQKKLRVVAVPIGNLSELSQRATDALAAADVIVCEDTRVTGFLLNKLGMKKKLISNEGSREEQVAQQVIGLLNEGKNVVLVSDAGYPMLSDPGERIISKVYEANYAVEVVNGPSSMMHAAVASGFPLNEFFFAGFLPSRSAERKRRIEQLAKMSCTVIVFETPHRIAAALVDINEAMGERELSVCRELTKLHETIYKGTAKELVEVVVAKGEIVIVFAPVKIRLTEATIADEVAKVKNLVAGGMRPKEACKQVATGSAYSSKDLYAEYLLHKP